MSGGGFNDALFYIKTSNEILDPLRVFVSDKALVKQYVKAKVGDAHNVTTIALLDTYDDALHFAYPADCVIKPTHLCGEVIFRRDSAPVDFQKVRSWLDANYYLKTREANSRHLRPRIIVEPYIFNQETVDDYKIFCFHGQPLIIQVDIDRHTHHTRNLYTADWELLPFTLGYPIGNGLPRPDSLSHMIEVAAKLSDEFSLIRIDLYTNGQNVLVGEITNCHGGAQERFAPLEGDKMMARLLFGEAGFSPSILKAQSVSHRPGATFD
jgi:hypothetical protein